MFRLDVEEKKTLNSFKARDGSMKLAKIWDYLSKSWVPFNFHQFLFFLFFPFRDQFLKYFLLSAPLIKINHRPTPKLTKQLISLKGDAYSDDTQNETKKNKIFFDKKKASQMADDEVNLTLHVRILLAT